MEKLRLLFSGFAFFLLFCNRHLVNSLDAQSEAMQTCSSLFITNGGVRDAPIFGRSGCRWIFGNVIINNLDITDQTKLSPFLDSITVIEGYLKIENVSLPTTETTGIRFPQLRLIKGKTLLRSQFGTTAYSPAIFFRLLRGVNYVSFPQLRAIIDGDIFIISSSKLGFAKTVEWGNFFTLPEPQTRQKVYINNLTLPIPTCSPSCLNFSIPITSNISTSTGNKRCFGPSSEDCQNPDFTQRTQPASPLAPSSRVTNCPSDCIGGCVTDNTRSNNSYSCVACRGFMNLTSGECSCPVLKGFKLANSSMCGMSCPFPTILALEGQSALPTPSCNLRCDASRTERNGQCVVRTLASNLKECYPEAEDINDGVLQDNNVAKLVGCQRVVGNLQIFGDLLSYDQATKYLSDISVITGSLVVQQTSYSNLNFLSNLRVIEARSYQELSGLSGALVIKNNQQLTSISALRYLKLVNGGQVVIQSNGKGRICGLSTPYALKMVFNASNVIFSGSDDTTSNNNSTACECSPSCNLTPPNQNSLSCWVGGDASACFQCPKYTDSTTGVCLPKEETCSPPSQYFMADPRNGLCGRCDAKCSGGCRGPLPTDCIDCLGVRRNVSRVCADWCDFLEYETTIVDAAKGFQRSLCYSCHSACTRGCIGPENTLCSSTDPAMPQSPSIGCFAGCKLIHREPGTESIKCVTSCPEGFIPNSSPVKAKDRDSTIFLREMARICRNQADRIFATSAYNYCVGCSERMPNCQSCSMSSDQTNIQCTRCSGSYLLLQRKIDSDSMGGQSRIDQQCVSECPPGYLAALDSRPSGGNPVRRCKEA